MRRWIYAIGVCVIIGSLGSAGCSTTPQKIEQEKVEQENTKVSIKEYGSEMPSSHEEPETLFFEGHGSGEYIELTVDGKITNLRSVSLIYNEEAGEGESMFLDGEVKQGPEVIENQKIIIETYFTCGMPAERIEWETETGTDYIIPTEDGKN